MAGAERAITILARDGAAGIPPEAPGRPAAEDAPSHLRELERGPRYRGGIYAWRNGVLRGWAVDLDDIARPLSIALEAAGEPIARFASGERRPDLEEALPGNAAGFLFDFASLDEMAR